MKTRMTFRMEGDLATMLRALPNQTKFVEDALRDALGRTCPVCRGDGRLPVRSLRVTNVRQGGMAHLSRDEARHLQRIFRLGREVAATRIDLAKHGRRVRFTMIRSKAELLSGILSAASPN